MMYLDANIVYGWALSQKLPVNGFEMKRKYVKSQWNVYKKLWSK